MKNKVKIISAIIISFLIGVIGTIGTYQAYPKAERYYNNKQKQIKNKLVNDWIEKGDISIKPDTVYQTDTVTEPFYFQNIFK